MPPPPACLLDLTRLVSRLGRGPLTGIDRVELAYLDHFCGRDGLFFALVRTPAGALLLDRAGAGMIRAAAGNPAVDLPPAGWLSRVLHRKDPVRAAAETLARSHATGRAPVALLSRLLRRSLPRGFAYLNVGHSNLGHRMMRQLRAGGAGKVAAMVHDTIPLDHPEFSRPDAPPAFARKLAVVSAHADLVIHIAEATRATTEPWLTRMGRCPDGLVAHLGVPVPRPDPGLVPPGLIGPEGHFVAIGTIEPRKNHTLLLDLWHSLPRMPRLYILGNRGWASKDLLRRLDALPPDGPIRVLSGLPDEAVAAILGTARALLFPSRAEGFGLPLLEAAALGVPVVCSDLPVARELLGTNAVYLDPDDSYSWVEEIAGRAAGQVDRVVPAGGMGLPKWDDHFNLVLSRLG